MYQRPSKEQVVAALQELGNGAGEIAGKLYDKGIKGVPKKRETCPLARYLEKKFKGTWFSVGGGVVTIGLNTATPESVKLSFAAQNFVSYFDQGTFSFIVSAT